MKLSLIIPVYNVELFIGQCLNSICSQCKDEDLFEIIVVNDGTPDNSMKIVKQYADNRKIRIIEQENQGLSVARNVGLDSAKGDYIWFVDSDDWLTEEAISYIVKSIVSHIDVDVFATVLNMYYEISGKTVIEYKPNFNVRNGRDYMFRNHNANRGACQRYILKKSFLDRYDLKFIPGIYHEDGEFCNRMLYLAKSLIILEQPVYNYRIRTSGSIMSSRPMKANDDLIKVYESLKKFADEYVVGNDDYWMYKVKIYSCLKVAIQFSRNEVFTPEFDAFYQKNKNMIKDEAKEILCKGKNLPLSYYFDVLPYALFPKIPTQIRQIVKRLLVALHIKK